MDAELLEQGERVMARPSGRMEASDGEQLASAIEQMLQPAVRHVTVDLADVEFINYGGIRALLRLARTLGLSNRMLEFLGGNQAVRDSLDQAGFDDFFAFTPPYVSSRGKTNGIQ